MPYASRCTKLAACRGITVVDAAVAATAAVTPNARACKHTQDMQQTQLTVLQLMTPANTPNMILSVYCVAETANKAVNNALPVQLVSTAAENIPPFGRASAHCAAVCNGCAVLPTLLLTVPCLLLLMTYSCRPG